MAKLIKGTNDLATCNPQLASEWHPTKNGNLTSQDVTCGSHQKVWWLYSYDDPKTGKHFDFEWQATISSRNNGLECPFLSGRAIWIGFNDLASCNPKLAREWHPTKNGNLTPQDVTCGSREKVWWLLPYDDPKTGKHFDFEWQNTVYERMKGCNCPFLSHNPKVWSGFNDLATVNPQLAREWHPTKNGKLTPCDVTSNSNKKVWWLYSYDDPKTGKHFDFEWYASIQSRTLGQGCSFLCGKSVWIGFNDLASCNPKLAREWHPTKNGDLTPQDVTCGTSKKVWWLLSYDDPNTGKHFDFEWQASIANRNNGSGCPFLDECTNHEIWAGFNDLETRNSQLAREWHPTKNGDLTPQDVTCGSSKKVWWLLPYDDPNTGKHFDFEWQATISSRNNGTGCPFLSGKSVWLGFNDLTSCNPKLAREWHPTKNGNLTPQDVTCGSREKVWWLLPYDDPKTGKHFDFEWQASISSRNNGNGCPYLTSSKTETLLYDLMKTNHIDFFAEQKFSNCKDINQLPFDLYLLTKKCIIELDGLQHFEAIDYFGGKNALKINQKHDNIKNKYCVNNNIPLLRIPYIYDPVVDKNKIEEMVLEFIRTRKVPQEILDFYAKHKFSNYVDCVREL